MCSTRRDMCSFLYVLCIQLQLIPISKCKSVYLFHFFLNDFLHAWVHIWIRSSFCINLLFALIHVKKIHFNDVEFVCVLSFF